MITVNPQKTNIPVPRKTHLLRGRAMNLDMLGHPSLAKGSFKFLISRREGGTIRPRGEIVGVRVNRDDRTKTIMRGNHREHYSGTSFETADFHDCTPSRNTSGQESKESLSLIHISEPTRR